MPDLRRIFASSISVFKLPRDLIADMTRDRTSTLKTSGIMGIERVLSDFPIRFEPNGVAGFLLISICQRRQGCGGMTRSRVESDSGGTLPLCHFPFSSELSYLISLRLRSGQAPSQRAGDCENPVRER